MNIHKDNGLLVNCSIELIAVCVQYLMKLSTGKQRRMPIHFSRSMNNALTFFFKLHSKLDLTFNNC